MAAALENARLSACLAGMLLWITGSAAPAVDYAGDVFSLELWKLIIPVDDDGDGVADEVLMPVLRNFEDPGYFHLSKTKDSILFRVPAASAGAGSPAFRRCGLRELVKKSETPAAWGTNDGRVHNMTISFAFNTPPEANSRIIAAGIYAGDEPVISIGLEKGNLMLARDGLDPLVLDEGY
ncbi:MAG: polysaccharide lyase family 7 protein, partial [Verrucomicrobiales bacterium]